MIRIAPEGRWFILTAVAVAGAARVFTGRWLGAAIWLPVAVWVVAFFRDPERIGPRGQDLVLAPADGRVVGVGEVDEPAFFGGSATRVSIFMNVFDCHVNRYPTRAARSRTGITITAGFSMQPMRRPAWTTSNRRSG